MIGVSNETAITDGIGHMYDASTVDTLRAIADAIERGECEIMGLSMKVFVQPERFDSDGFRLPRTPNDAQMSFTLRAVEGK